MKVGECVLVDDGKLVLEVLEMNEVDIVCLKVLFGGVFFLNKGVNLFNMKIFFFCIIEKDEWDLVFIFM